MPGVVIVGAQFGDEGKGKMTDYLANRADCVVRYQGGNNAGHTVVIGGHEFRLHIIPSGIFYPEKVCVIGNGMVIDPEILFQELDDLLNKGLQLARLYISDRAHLIMPYHLRLDEAEENYRGAGASAPPGGVSAPPTPTRSPGWASAPANCWNQAGRSGWRP